MTFPITSILKVAMFPNRLSPHRRRAAWSAFWNGEQRLFLDVRWLQSTEGQSKEDDWIRLAEKGILVGTTGFHLPAGHAMLSEDEAWPLHLGYFEKIGLWVRGAEPLEWIGDRARASAGTTKGWDIRPQTVGISLNEHSEQKDFQPLDQRGRRITMGSVVLEGALHRFNDVGTSNTVEVVLELRPRGRVYDDYPVFHVFGPAWWTRRQVERVVDAIMNMVREHLSDGQWVDPESLRSRFHRSLSDRGMIHQGLSDLIDHRDLVSDVKVFGHPMDEQVLHMAGGQRLSQSVKAGWLTFIDKDKT